MAVYVSNLIINKGTDFSQTFDVFNSDGTSLNLVGYSGFSHMRKSPSSSSYVGFGVSFIDAINGKIKLSMGSTITSNLKSGRQVYDILLVSPSNIKSIVIEGMVSVKPGISTGCF